jgi:hypothetical protein
MKPRANTQATLLGNFAGAALDDIINTNGKYQMIETIKTNFREKALEFCTCPWFDAKKFYTDANQQAFNLQQVVDILFPRTASQAQMSAFRGESLYDRKKAILEPSFVCEALGIQGRVDLMTTDCKLLVEQKSGRNMNIETHQVDPGYHSYQLEPHYVQLLLYYGVLQHNFKLSNDRVNIRLLYSKYQPQDGLMVVAYYQKLFKEAIEYRNQLVAASFEIAKEGFEHALKFMVEEALNDGTGMPTAESIASGGKTAQQPASSILLMSYTNRAVDEICEMLVDSGIPFLRLGSEYSCDERFRPYLIEKAISNCPKLEAIKQYIIGTRVIVGTTSMMTSKPFIFSLKHFKLAIIDESSQILEPNLIGLLSAVDKFILIGDYKQLPAVVQQSEQDSGIPTINDSQKGGVIDMSILQDICLTNCRNSLFERLIHWEDHEERSEFIGILRRQGRMHPEIAEFPNRMFYRREKLEPVPCPHQLETELSYTLPSADALDDLLKEHRMIFLPSKFCKEPNVSDKINANGHSAV